MRVCNGSGKLGGIGSTVEGLNEETHIIEERLNEQMLWLPNLPHESVPVFDSDGRILLALTALGESGHIDVSAGAPVPRALAACARELARTLGGGAAA